MSDKAVGLPGNSEELASFFDTRASSYEQHMQETVEDYDTFYQSVTDALPDLGAEPRILDLGIGTGLELDCLFERFPDAQVTGIDISVEMLAQLSRKDRPWIDTLTLITDSFLDLDLGSKAYHAVISSMALHHWIPSVKLDLYGSIHHALLPKGPFVNGDYIVSEGESSWWLTSFAETDLNDRHNLHIDVPVSFDHGLRLLAEAGFGKVASPFRRTNVAVFVAFKN